MSTFESKKNQLVGISEKKSTEQQPAESGTIRRRLVQLGSVEWVQQELRGWGSGSHEKVRIRSLLQEEAEREGKQPVLQSLAVSWFELNDSLNSVTVQ